LGKGTITLPVETWNEIDRANAPRSYYDVRPWEKAAYDAIGSFGSPTGGFGVPSPNAGGGPLPQFRTFDQNEFDQLVKKYATAPRDIYATGKNASTTVPIYRSGDIITDQIPHLMQQYITGINAHNQNVANIMNHQMAYGPGSPAMISAQTGESKLPIEQMTAQAHQISAEASKRQAEANLMMAGPHADYFRKLASEGQLVPPGYAIFSPESRKATFENPQRAEAFAPLARDAIMASMEETPTGKIVNPFAFMDYMNLMGRTLAKERGQEWKDVTVREMNREMVGPYIHRIIQTNPKTMRLKPESKEYEQLYNDTLRELYK